MVESVWCDGNSWGGMEATLGGGSFSTFLVMDFGTNDACRSPRAAPW
eukprot:CAMPEP_0116832252 /NCGR_PEP_ID=MMETSP0418-20121206/5790_1 /TAXON_ID=1158023 /ORGANISM="Astrosyne radiata, Strain 13vi08-1A" /LENGTH=46 /DNA_ID= /DNA_START= /DNA_END= /DNA_ORIENTATION=